VTERKSAQVQSERDQLTERALALLQSPDFWDKYTSALSRNGLVGEERNAEVLYIAGISRLLEKPLNGIVKGHSSSGKNHVVNQVLRFHPP
jgi:DNA primase